MHYFSVFFVAERQQVADDNNMIEIMAYFMGLLCFQTPNAKVKEFMEKNKAKQMSR